MAKHLELLKSDQNEFRIQINSMVGRVSLLADHPKYKLKDALNLESNSHRTSGQLFLVPMSTKNLFVLEDRDHKGEKSQNFIYVSDELSGTIQMLSSKEWVQEHIVDFFTRSISVLFFALYIVYYFSVMRFYNTTDTLFVLRYITGVITVMFAISYYYLRSSKTKSSFLKFCFKTELVFFILAGSANNFYHLQHFFNNATDIF